MSSILPNNDNNTTPKKMLKYANPDVLRQMMQQERKHWNLKVNRDVDFYDNNTLSKHTGEIHNTGEYQKLEIRTFPDNGAYPGYSGIINDSGHIGISHDLDKWDHGISEKSKNETVNRVQIGAMAKVDDSKGYGLDDHRNITKKTDNRQASILFDPIDGRAYYFSNDDPMYVNNQDRDDDTKLPLRTIARIADIPTNITDLHNDLDFVADPDYHHTDNNFTNSNRFILDNLDDRTFVYPEIARDRSGDFIANDRVGLNGEIVYGAGDGEIPYHSQPDLGKQPDLGHFGDRYGEDIQAYGKNINSNGIMHRTGFLPAIFRSLEELERVDLVDQTQTPFTHDNTPGAKRPYNYYLFDGIWGPTWFDRHMYKDSYLAQSMYPSNMELLIDGSEPTPFSQLETTNDEQWDRSMLYQWRYNRVSLTYHSNDINIYIVSSGSEYKVNDILRWTFGDDVFLYKVTSVGATGQIQDGEYISARERIFEQDPSTHGVGIYFTNTSGVGHDAKLSVSCKATITNHATQIKNNLYAYVDVIPTVRSDNNTQWSDNQIPDDENQQVFIRSTAAYPSYSGINKGIGGDDVQLNDGTFTFYEHGGNATAGAQVHLFRYVINTQNPTWVIRNGIQVFTGQWVDQGPMSVERPCDIKALFLSNYDTNNFNNYYKFMLDSIFKHQKNSPDYTYLNDPNATAPLYLHLDQVDPAPDRRFTQKRINSDTLRIEETDITDKVLYVNGATGVSFMYNTSYKNDPTFGYGARPVGWFSLAGTTAR